MFALCNVPEPLVGQAEKEERKARKKARENEVGSRDRVERYPKSVGLVWCPLAWFSCGLAGRLGLWDCRIACQSAVFHPESLLDCPFIWFFCGWLLREAKKAAVRALKALRRAEAAEAAAGVRRSGSNSLRFPISALDFEVGL